MQVSEPFAAAEVVSLAECSPGDEVGAMLAEPMHRRVGPIMLLLCEGSVTADGQRRHEAGDVLEVVGRQTQNLLDELQALPVGFGARHDGSPPTG